MFSGHIDPGHEVTDTVCGMTIGKLGVRFGQPSVWVDDGDLAVHDQRGDDRPVVFALVRARDKVFSWMRGKGLIDRSTVLVSSSTRPSSRNTVSPNQRVSV